MQTHSPRYNYEVHVASYGEVDWSTLPKPFFLNKVSPPNQISSIVTAEVKTLAKALCLFDEIRAWCNSVEPLRSEGCRITIEEMVVMSDLDTKIDNQPLIDRREWEIEHNAFVAFSDIHADGLWNLDLYQALIDGRGYIPIEYTTRQGKELSVLTLHFLYPDRAIQEFEYLNTVLSRGGFKGTVSVENTLAVAVIGPPLSRPIVVNR